MAGSARVSRGLSYLGHSRLVARPVPEYAGRNDDSWIGALVFAGSLVVMLVAWVVLRVPVQKKIALLGGTVR